MKPIEEVIGYKFANSLLLAEALTHPSLAYETQRPRFDNQRLEFLGDAVIQLVLTEWLYETFPGFNEGKLTKMRARLVSGEALSHFAKSIGLGGYVLMGKGEEASGGRERASTLADAFEALMGALFLDGGIGEARRLIHDICDDEVRRLAEAPVEKNPKGQLQEVLQGIAKEGPEYRMVREMGPDHCKEFEVEVVWRGVVLAKGKGSSKKVAEVNAARDAIARGAWQGVLDVG